MLNHRERRFIESLDKSFIVKQLVEDAEKGMEGRVHSTSDFGYQWHILKDWEKLLTIVFFPMLIPLCLVFVVLPHFLCSIPTLLLLSYERLFRGKRK
jgi:hypothetical protein